MTTYAIGDIQGCYDELQALLDELKFDFRCDTLWLTGDLVNRGPRSVEVLRFIKSLGECAITVLGNHDLHLLAVAYGHEAGKKDDTLAPILEAPDREELLLWVSTRPLLHHDEIRRLTLIHAGLPPQWTLKDAMACAREAEGMLASAHSARFKSVQGKTSCTQSPAISGVVSKKVSKGVAPIGSPASNTTCVAGPRCAMPITSLTWTSRQARTQRLQWIHASRKTRMAGWLMSGAGRG